MKPIFDWWYQEIGVSVEMSIGYRANEKKRAARMIAKLNNEGLSEWKDTFSKLPDGRNKWEKIAWRKPVFPLIRHNVFRDQIENYWEFREVRFASLNNCVGCFHRNPILLRKMYDEHSDKMKWFASQEGGKNGTWRSDMSYDQIFKHKLQYEISFAEFSECDSGVCGL
jgi:hypothetical protein